MSEMKLQYFFVIGVVIGSFSFLVPLLWYHQQTLTEKQAAKYQMRETFNRLRYNETLSDFMFNEVKILCMVMTHAKTHYRALRVKRTWGRRCNKLLFMSSEYDIDLDPVVLSINDTRSELWNKTRESFIYVHKHHIDEFDWYLKADDDNYIIIENLRYLLYQYNANTSLYFGHRFALPMLEEGYNAGGGYALSKKAVKKFVEKIVFNTTKCFVDSTSEDRQMGRCLAHEAIFVDCRDELRQQRFFPLGVIEHMRDNPDPEFWYHRFQYYAVPQGSTDCCSNTSIGFHYIKPKVMYDLEYFIYNAHPFGVAESGDKLPRKLSLQEIIKASDAPGSSKRFSPHKDYHNLESSEIF